MITHCFLPLQCKGVFWLKCKSFRETVVVPSRDNAEEANGRKSCSLNAVQIAVLFPLGEDATVAAARLRTRDQHASFKGGTSIQVGGARKSRRSFLHCKAMWTSVQLDILEGDSVFWGSGHVKSLTFSCGPLHFTPANYRLITASELRAAALRAPPCSIKRPSSDSPLPRSGHSLLPGLLQSVHISGSGTAWNLKSKRTRPQDFIGLARILKEHARYIFVSNFASSNLYA